MQPFKETPLKPHRRLVVLSRFPREGQVKTRLIPALGSAGATALHRRMLVRTLRTARAACDRIGAQLEIRFDGGSIDAMRNWLGDDWFFRPQDPGDLGHRLANAIDVSFSEGSTGTVVVGSDCPGLTPAVLETAFAVLQENTAVIGPATDGGYYLIGLSRSLPSLFQGIPWGSSEVLGRTMGALDGLGIRPAMLEPMDDLDRPEDLTGWQRIVGPEDASLNRVSVVIPTLDEAPNIEGTLEAVRRGHPHEVIVVDAGSRDGTAELAARAGAIVSMCRPGRGRQMNAGAVIASGSILVFLHADTVLPEGWAGCVLNAVSQPGVAAGAFRLGIDADFAGRRLIEFGANLRSQWLRMPYGDQALFMRKAVFEELGGFRDLQIMEDYDLVRRLHRVGRVLTLQHSVRTSGRRWQGIGAVRTTLMNQFMIAGRWLGVSDAKLASLYRNAAKPQGPSRTRDTP